eukprot:m.437833 g.437833  ORF g.437833 m.437833 type:complete len:633 (-) comp21439_c0_seq9:1636-3534(-)
MLLSKIKRLASSSNPNDPPPPKKKLEISGPSNFQHTGHLPTSAPVSTADDYLTIGSETETDSGAEPIVGTKNSSTETKKYSMMRSILSLSTRRTGSKSGTGKHRKELQISDPVDFKHTRTWTDGTNQQTQVKDSASDRNLTRATVYDKATLPMEPVGPEGVYVEGYLSTERDGVWTQRWYRLKQHSCAVLGFSDPSCTGFSDAVHFSGLLACNIIGTVNGQDGYAFSIQTKAQTTTFVCMSEEKMQTWVQAVRMVSETHVEKPAVRPRRAPPAPPTAIACTSLVPHDGFTDANAVRRADEDEFEALCIEQGLLTSDTTRTSEDTLVDALPDCKAAPLPTTTPVACTESGAQVEPVANDAVVPDVGYIDADQAPAEDTQGTPSVVVPAADAKLPGTKLPHQRMRTKVAPPTPPRPRRGKLPKNSPAGSRTGNLQASPARPPRPSERSQRLFAERHSNGEDETATSPTAPGSTAGGAERFVPVGEYPEANGEETRTPTATQREVPTPHLMQHTPAPVATEENAPTRVVDAMGACDHIEHPPPATTATTAENVSLDMQRCAQEHGHTEEDMDDAVDCKTSRVRSPHGEISGEPAPGCSCGVRVEEYKSMLQAAQNRIAHLEGLVEQLSAVGSSGA